MWLWEEQVGGFEAGAPPCKPHTALVPLAFGSLSPSLCLTLSVAPSPLVTSASLARPVVSSLCQSLLKLPRTMLQLVSLGRVPTLAPGTV